MVVLEVVVVIVGIIGVPVTVVNLQVREKVALVDVQGLDHVGLGVGLMIGVAEEGIGIEARVIVGVVAGVQDTVRIAVVEVVPQLIGEVEVQSRAAENPETIEIMSVVDTLTHHNPPMEWDLPITTEVLLLQ